MVLNMYAILDAKAEYYGTPFFQKTNGLAMRSFQDLVLDKQSTLSKYPEDFSLYLIASFDSNEGTVSVFKTGPQQIMKGTDVQVTE